MKTAAAPIPFAGSELRETRHVCAFFNSDDEEYRVLLPLIKDGFECGDKAVHVTPDQRGDHLRRLTAQGSIRPRNSAGNSSFGSTPKRTFGTVVSIRIGSWKYLSRWPAATPRIGDNDNVS